MVVSKFLMVFITIPFLLTGCGNEISTNDDIKVKPTQDVLKYFNISKKELRLIYPNVRRSRFIPHSRITADEFKTAIGKKCSQPTVSPKIDTGTTEVTFRQTGSTIDNTSDLHDYADIEFDKFHRESDSKYSITNSSWSKLMSGLKHGPQAYFVNYDPNYSEIYGPITDYAISTNFDNFMRFGCSPLNLRFPNYQLSHNTNELKELLIGHKEYFSYYKGEHKMPNGKSIEAYKQIEIFVVTDWNPFTGQYAPGEQVARTRIYSPEIANRQSAYCEAGLVGDYSFKEANESYLTDIIIEHELLFSF